MTIIAPAGKIILGTIGGFVILMLGIGIGAYPTEQKDISPYCPTEDSCIVEYVNSDGPGPKGKWYIIETTP